MRIAFAYGPFCLGGDSAGFDFDNLWTDRRGLTGSELSFFRISEELAKRGHEITLFTFSQKITPHDYRGMEVRTFQELPSVVDGSWDAVYSWNEAEPLRSVAPGPLRIVNLQINSFTHCRPGFDDYVDLWTSPSDGHRERILREVHPIATDFLMAGETYSPDPGKWDVLTNGCDADLYRELRGRIEQVPGRVVWASSPDRGLHWLLQMWPRIRSAVPEAHLKIFYKVESWCDRLVNVGDPVDRDIAEQRGRARYIREALRRLKGHGVELVDSVSREQIAEEMLAAQVLAYPCDTVNWTEGFSVTLMEACAAGVVPVTTDVDALGGIYGGAVPMVKSPVGERLGEFMDLIVRALRDGEYRDQVRDGVLDLARDHSWASIAERLEKMIEERRGAAV